ncbi:MAG: hypothetical protein ACJ8AI_28075 [Rhodopila sp.]
MIGVFVFRSFVPSGCAAMAAGAIAWLAVAISDAHKDSFVRNVFFALSLPH